MIPDHCKDVSLRSVDFRLTPENILKNSRGKKAYTRTRYIVLRNKNDFAVVRVEKENGVELFRRIVSVEVVSTPSDTVFIDDPSIDVLNLPQMARLSALNKGKTVVVSGMFNHVSFIKDAERLELRVFDVVPPKPSKLSVLVEKALNSGLVDLPVVPVWENLDLNVIAENVRTPAVVFPCRASGLRSEKKVYFLDETPRVETESTLIGCDLSKRIWRSLYRTKIKHLDMCPRDMAPKDQAARLVKCCKVKEGYELEGRTAVVPWGATVADVSAAISTLFKNDRHASD